MLELRRSRRARHTRGVARSLSHHCRVIAAVAQPGGRVFQGLELFRLPLRCRRAVLPFLETVQTIERNLLRDQAQEERPGVKARRTPYRKGRRDPLATPSHTNVSRETFREHHFFFPARSSTAATIARAPTVMLSRGAIWNSGE